MNAARAGILLLCLLIPAAMTFRWVSAAGDGLEPRRGAESGETEAATAAAADEGYCTPGLRRILRRVLQSCGLLGSGQTRGCQPLEAKNVATMSGGDFNALFSPMKERGGILQFEIGEAELDRRAKDLAEKLYSQKRGASYFFVVARASPDGAVSYNRKLSKKRAEAVMEHLRETFDDPDLEREVGLLWLGEEYAQLDPQFCEWQRSGEEGSCQPRHLNRSAFVAWIDCRL